MNRANRFISAMVLLAALVINGHAEDKNEASIGYSEAGTLYLFSDSGQLLRTIKTTQPIRDFAVAPDANQIVFSVADASIHGGPLYLLNASTGAVKLLTRHSKTNYKVYADPEFSPDGSSIVLAMHGSAHGDLVEASGPIGILLPETGQVSQIAATTNVDGYGPAYANSPHWSPNGSSVLFNFEIGAAIVDIRNQKLRDLTSLMEEGADNEWSNAVGWFGPKCVVYIAGKDQEDANRKPAHVLNLESGKTTSAAELLGVKDEKTIGLIAFSPRLWIRSAGNKFIAVSKNSGWDIPIKSRQNVFIRIIPLFVQPDATLPEACQ